MLDYFIMPKRLFFLLMPCFFASGCGIKAPLYLPPDPNDSYLSRIQKSVNDLTGQDTVTSAPPETVQELTVEEMPADQEAEPSSTEAEKETPTSAHSSETNPNH